MELEVPFHDVDALSVVWHGWYFKYFEIARSALFRAHSIDAGDLVPLGLAMYVIETQSRHLRPLRYGDRFQVAAWFSEYTPRIEVSYEIRKGDETRVAQGRTVLVTLQISPQKPEESQMLLETPPVLLERMRGPRKAVLGAHVPGASK
ncbi:MAG: acyl-CoA thioesterase [Deltaproteobacteria bacterium]|nr:acyl-CoA thioesterase [Deltaproteobacteria bacterium]